MVRRILIPSLIVVAGCASSPAPPPPAPLDVPKLQTRPGARPQPPRADRQATAEEARDYAIELLEREQYEELVVKLLSPNEQEKIRNRKGGLARVVSELSTSNKRIELLETLRSVKNVKPETTEEGRVRFPIPGGPPADSARGDVTFEYVEGRWYIRN